MNYNTYQETTFNIKELSGISTKTIEEHLKLYAGYVKHANLILQKIAALTTTSEEAVANAYTVGELRRRFGFEFGGMRNHEYYFHQLEGGSAELGEDSKLKAKIVEQWGSFDVWFTEFTQLAMTRGIGWAFVYQDTTTGNLLNTWVGEQHDGHLTGLSPILALDMWEHSYMLDVPPSEKKSYIDAFFKNLNWSVVEKRFTTNE
jgi:superoxide dismutase, Fe-Mn family